MPVYHSLTATTPDDPAYEIRPSHWNSAHSVALVGSEAIGAFSNAGNVSFAVATNGYITASANVTAAASPVNVTAGTTSGNLQTIAFSNSNGVSFGLNGSTITASHNGITSQSVQTQASGNIARTGYTSTTQAGSTVGVTHDTQGISAAWPPFITTYAAQTAQPVAASAANGSYAFSTLSFSNANGVSFATSAGSAIVGSVATTYRASNDAVGLNTALTAGPLAWTVNSSGISLNASSAAGTTSGFTGANISGSMTHNTAGLALSLSVAAPGGAASASNYFTGNTTQSSSGTMALSSQIFRGYGIVSVGQSNGSVLISTPDPVTVTDMSIGISGGNTSGHTGTVANGQVVFAGGNAITLSGSTNGSSMTITISGGGGGGGGVGISAGTQSVSTGTVVYSNSNNVTFGMSGSSRVTASVGLNLYALGNTTQSSSTVLGVGAVSLNALGAMTAGFSNGSVQLSAPATSSLVGAGNISISTNGSTITISGSASPVSFSAGTTSGALGSVVFSNSNGVSFGMNGSTITASHNGLTTARASNDGVGLNTAQSNVTWTVNSSGLSIDARGYAGTGTSATNASVTLNSNGLAISVNAGGPSAYVSSVNGSSGAISLNVGSSLSSSTNGSSITFGLASNITTALQSAGAYLTTARASNDAIGLNTALTANGVSMTANSSGLSLNFPAFLTTQSGQAFSASGGSSAFQTLSFTNSNGFTFSNTNGSVVGSYTVPTVTQFFSNTGTTFNGANVSGSMTLNTNGLALSLSAAAGGGGGGAGAVNLLGANTAGNTTATGSTLGFSGVNLTLSGTNESNIVFSAPATSSLSVTGQLSLSVNGSTISLGVPSPYTASGTNPYADCEVLAGTQGNGTIVFDPAFLPNVQFDRIVFPVSHSVGGSTGTVSASFFVGVFSRNASTLSLVGSTSTSVSFNASSNNGTAYSIYSGMRHISVGSTATLTQGQYWIGVMSSVSTSSQNIGFSQMVISNVASPFVGYFGSSHTTTQQLTIGQGVYSAQTAGIPSSVAFSQIRGSDSNALRMPIVMFASSTV